MLEAKQQPEGDVATVNEQLNLEGGGDQRKASQDVQQPGVKQP